MTTGTAPATVPAVGSVNFNNTGTFNVAALADATGGKGQTGAAATGTATAFAFAGGVLQRAANANFNNAGKFTVIASANAAGVTGASAVASAVGVSQSVVVKNATFTNSGTFNVAANAVAAAGTMMNATGTHATAGNHGFASATALGLEVYTPNGATETFDVTNSGTFTVQANAKAPGSAFAHAVGMNFSATATVPSTATVPVHNAMISGSIVNSGSINVIAKAAGPGTTATTVVHTSVGGATSKVVTTHPHSSAQATGISMTSGANTATISNSGMIDVTAITNGGSAEAYGIRVVGNGEGIAPAAGDVLDDQQLGRHHCPLLDRWRDHLPSRRGDRRQRSSQPDDHQPHGCGLSSGSDLRQYRACQ